MVAIVTSSSLTASIKGRACGGVTSAKTVLVQHEETEDAGKVFDSPPTMVVCLLSWSSECSLGLTGLDAPDPHISAHNAASATEEGI